MEWFECTHISPNTGTAYFFVILLDCESLEYIRQKPPPPVSPSSDTPNFSRHGVFPSFHYIPGTFFLQCSLHEEVLVVMDYDLFHIFIPAPNSNSVLRRTGSYDHKKGRTTGLEMVPSFSKSENGRNLSLDQVS